MTASVRSSHRTYCDCTSDMQTCAPGRDVVNCASSTSVGKGGQLPGICQRNTCCCGNYIDSGTGRNGRQYSMSLSFYFHNNHCPHHPLFSSIHSSSSSVLHTHCLSINCHYQLLSHYHNPQPTYSTHIVLPSSSAPWKIKRMCPLGTPKCCAANSLIKIVLRGICYY